MKSGLNNYRLYGRAEIQVVVLHGGPGAPGNVAPLARELSKWWGVLEPFQTRDTIAGQVEELHDMITEKCQVPVVLVGHSWGAWLAFIYSATYPKQVKKCILIGAGPFEEHYAAGILDTRLGRMSEEEKKVADQMLETMQCDHCRKDVVMFEKFGKFMSRADAFDRIYEENEVVEHQPEIFYKVWPEALRLRRSGELLHLGEKISCPVVAIHGDYDPHPADGVKYPLADVVTDFKFLLIEKCGHDPWNERQAKEKFLNILSNQMDT